jgi:hypothetical protein
MKFCTSILLLILVTPLLRAQDYVIEALKDENAVAAMPFSISRVVPFDRGLRLFINTDNPGAVSDLLRAGKLQAQLSDNQAGTEKLVPLSLGKAVWCPDSDTSVYLSFNDPLPNCDGNTPTRIEDFLEVSVSLGPGLDLAIGNDPDYLWLIGER